MHKDLMLGFPVRVVNQANPFSILDFEGKPVRVGIDGTCDFNPRRDNEDLIV
jgi:hypothetical protein